MSIEALFALLSLGLFINTYVNVRLSFLIQNWQYLDKSCLDSLSEKQRGKVANKFTFNAMIKYRIWDIRRLQGFLNSYAKEVV